MRKRPERNHTSHYLVVPPDVLVVMRPQLAWMLKFDELDDFGNRRAHLRTVSDHDRLQRPPQMHRANTRASDADGA